MAAPALCVDVMVNQPSLGVAVLQIPVEDDTKCVAKVAEVLRTEGSFPLLEPAILAAVECLNRLNDVPSNIEANSPQVVSEAQLCDMFNKSQAIVGKGVEESSATPHTPSLSSVVQAASTKTLSHLAQLEIVFANQLRELISKRETALDDLRMKHALAMQRAQEKMEKMGTDFATKISRLVDHQVRELETLEQNYATQIQNLKQQQKKDYRTQAFGPTPLRSISSAPQPTAKQKGENADFSDVVELPPSQPNEFTGEGFLRLLFENKNHMQHTLWIGSQLKRGYSVWVVESDPLNLLRLDTHTPTHQTSHSEKLTHETQLRMMLTQSLYSHNALGAWVRVVSRDAVFAACSSRSAEDPWCGVTMGSTDNHFPTPDKQMSLLKAECEKQPLACGEFLVTRHSNVCFPVNFHMVIDNMNSEDMTSEVTNPQSRILQGLVHVLNMADDEGVCTVCIRANLLHGVSPKGEDDTNRVVMLFKVLKMFMADNCVSQGGSLKSFVVVVPHSDDSARFHRVCTIMKQQFGC